MVAAPPYDTVHRNWAQQSLERAEIQWWQPFPTLLFTKIGITLFLLLLAAALEITYQVSANNKGLCEIETDSYIRYTWVYIPALMMFIAKLTLGMIVDSTKVSLINLKSYNIITATPDERTARLSTNDVEIASSKLLNKLLPHGTYSNNGTGDFDPAFQAILFATDHDMPLAELFDEANFPRIARLLEHYYRICFAQLMNREGRMPASKYANPINGTITGPNHLRLQQHAISTRILEGLLVTIAICLVTSFWLLDTREVLPKNPCSIAAAASLLAGAGMLEPGTVLPGSEWCSDEELVRRRVFSGDVFSMGFWSEGDEDEQGRGRGGRGGRRFGIDRGEASRT